ncbi:MAG: hypothetical protein F6J93_04685 [Oscillatoria sp. SIO1A7]|nr:hypothetical protein [Oscillatoria sp. SIO1A7]
MMRIVLQPEQEQFVREQLERGKYSTVDDLVVEAFRLLEEREQDHSGSQIDVRCHRRSIPI